MSAAIALVSLAARPGAAIESFTSPNPKAPDAVPYRRSNVAPSPTPGTRPGIDDGANSPTTPAATPSPASPPTPTA